MKFYLGGWLDTGCRSNSITWGQWRNIKNQVSIWAETQPQVRHIIQNYVKMKQMLSMTITSRLNYYEVSDETAACILTTVLCGWFVRWNKVPSVLINRIRKANCLFHNRYAQMYLFHPKWAEKTTQPIAFWFTFSERFKKVVLSAGVFLLHLASCWFSPAWFFSKYSMTLWTSSGSKILQYITLHYRG